MDVVLLVGAALAAFLGGTWYFDAPQRHVRELRRAPRRLLGSVREGQRARVVGQVAAIGEPLVAPLTGRACVLYIAEVYSMSKKTGGALVVREERAVPFVLDDGSGRFVIDPTSAQLALRGVRGEAGVTHAGMTALLERHHLTVRHVRYHERVVEVGADVAVLGESVREPDPAALPAGTFRTDLPEQLRMQSSARFPLLISDNPDTTR